MAHRQGSRKEQVHTCFSQKGAEVAAELAASLGIKEGSAKSWIRSWGGRLKSSPAPRTSKAPRSTISKGRGSGKVEGKRARIVKGALGKRYDGTLITILEKTTDVAWPYKVELKDGLVTSLDEWEFEIIQE